MTHPIKLYILVLIIAFSSCQPAGKQAGTESSPQLPAREKRIISLSGMLTEVLFDLGHGGQIVGTDVTSTYPKSTDDIPKLGHISQLNAEAILQLQPDVLFVEQSTQGQPVLDQLRMAGLQIVAVPTGHQLFNAAHAARYMSRYLESGSELADLLYERIEHDSLVLSRTLSLYANKPKVLFIYARGMGRLSVAGTGTAAAVIIEKAGGQNAITAFEGFQVLTPEALVESAPDVILMFSSGLASLDGVEGLSRIPGMEQTPAFQHKRVVAMDGHYLTAFGPRAAQAADQLARAIHQMQEL
ncbi:MAG: ABC transporter substrate-binding protein [Saprospiraceae bacterium]|nr:ABC transporter substrate-binding protein [Lewinella sp.]